MHKVADLSLVVTFQEKHYLEEQVQSLLRKADLIKIVRFLPRQDVKCNINLLDNQA